jgi:hypothetical protein
MQRVRMLKQVVHIVTTGLKRVKETEYEVFASTEPAHKGMV